MRSEYNNKYEKDSVDYNCIKPSINYQKCEELASQSKDLYNKALYYNNKIEKYLTMADRAKCKAKHLEEQLQYQCNSKELQEQLRSAWWEYHEFIESSNHAASKAEAFMKASCKLLQKSQECYSNLNSNNDIWNHNK